jgi:hypothetical protein
VIHHLRADLGKLSDLVVQRLPIRFDVVEVPTAPPALQRHVILSLVNTLWGNQGTTMSGMALLAAWASAPLPPLLLLGVGLGLGVRSVTRRRLV